MSEEQRNRIHYTEVGAGCLDDCGRLWYSAIGFNSLFCYDIKNNSLEWKGFFPDEPVWDAYLFSNCIIWNDYLVFAPDYASNIAVYNTKNEVFSRIPLENAKGNKKFHCMIKQDNYVYVFGDKIPYYICIDMSSMSATVYDDLYIYLEKIGKTGLDYFLSRNVCKASDGKYYLLGARSNALIKFNASSREYSAFRIGDDNGIYNNLRKIGDKLYLVPGKNRRFSVWSIEENSLSEYGEMLEKNACFQKMYFNEPYLYVLPDRGKIIVRWSSEEIDSITTDDIPDKYCGEEVFSNDGEVTKFNFLYEDDYYILFFSRLNRKLFIYDKNKNEERGTYLYLNHELRENIKAGYERCFKCAWRENALYGLKDMLNGGV